MIPPSKILAGIAILFAATTFVIIVKAPADTARPWTTDAIMLLGLCFVAVSVILVDTSKSLEKDAFVPQVIHPPAPQHHHHHPPAPPPPNQDFVVAEGLQKPKKPRGQSVSLGKRLKDAGWIVVFAEWCGFCKKQHDLFEEHDEELHEIIVAEGAMTDDMKALNEGFPAFMNCDKKLKHPGYIDNIAGLEALLEKS